MATCAIARYYSIMARSAETCRRTGTPKRDLTALFFSVLTFTQTLSAASHRAFVLSIEPKITAPSYFCGRISAAARRLLERRNFSEFHSSRRVTATLITPSTNTKFFERYVIFQDRFQIFFGLTAVLLSFLTIFLQEWNS
jgi:hypothetical protein